MICVKLASSKPKQCTTKHKIACIFVGAYCFCTLYNGNSYTGEIVPWYWTERQEGLYMVWPHYQCFIKWIINYDAQLWHFTTYYVILTDITMKQFSNLITKTTDNCKLKLLYDHNISCCKLVTLMHIYQPEMLFNIFLISHNKFRIIDSHVWQLSIQSAWKIEWSAVAHYKQKYNLNQTVNSWKNTGHFLWVQSWIHILSLVWLWSM